MLRQRVKGISSNIGCVTEQGETNSFETYEKEISEGLEKVIHNWLFLSIIVRTIKSTGIRWAWQVSRTGEIRHAQRILLRKSERR